MSLQAFLFGLMQVLMRFLQISIEIKNHGFMFSFVLSQTMETIMNMYLGEDRGFLKANKKSYLMLFKIMILLIVLAIAGI